MSFGAHTAIDDQKEVRIIVKETQKVAASFKELSLIRHCLFVYPQPTAPLVCWFFEILGPVEYPLRREIYFDVQDSDQTRDLEQLVRQRTVSFHLADGTLQVLNTKEIHSPSNTSKVLSFARDHARGILTGQYNFDDAKEAFQGEHSLDKIADLLSDFPRHARTCMQCKGSFGNIHRAMSEALDPWVLDE